MIATPDLPWLGHMDARRREGRGAPMQLRFGSIVTGSGRSSGTPREMHHDIENNRAEMGRTGTATQ